MKVGVDSYNFKSLTQLRCVCRSFNTLIEPIAFYHTNIQLDLINSCVHETKECLKQLLQQKLENMAGAYVGNDEPPRGIWRWTRSLVIDDAWGSSAEDNPPMEDRVALLCQAIKALKRLERLR